MQIKFLIFPIMSFAFVVRAVAKKIPFILACFQASYAPRPENSNSNEKDALFGLGRQINIKNIATL
jgi:hypothetical protein